MSWASFSIADCVESAISGFASGDNDESGIAQIRMNNVDREGRLNFDKIRYVPRDDKRDERYLLEKDDVLFNATNSPALVGKTALVQELPERFVFSNHFIRIRTNKGKLFPAYLACWLTFQQQRGRFELLCNKWVNQASIRREDLLGLMLSLPSVPEQHRIATILNKADVLRTRRREAVAKLDCLLQSVFLDTFGSPIGNPKGWPQRSLGELARIQTGGTPPSSEAGSFDGPVPFVTPGDLGGLIAESRRTLTPKGALLSRMAPANSTLVCCIGATIGKMGFATKDSAFNQQINAITWGSDIDPSYGYYAMRFLAGEVARRGASTTLPILKKSEFEKLLMTVPKKSDQEEFTRFASRVERQRAVLDQEGKSLDELFLSLQHKFLSERG
jgi:type I restriction enzyme, S subunit